MRLQRRVFACTVNGPLLWLHTLKKPGSLTAVGLNYQALAQ